MRQNLATERFPPARELDHARARGQALLPLTAGGADVNAQLAQARELEAKLAEEYRTVRLLRASIAGEASVHGKRARELGRQARDHINADFNVDDPNTPSERARSKLPPRRCYGSCPPP
jgi:hypothetical protein